MSTHAIISPSTLKDALKCNGRPAMCINEPDSGNDASELGTLAHLILEVSANAGMKASAEQTFDYITRLGVAPELNHADGRIIEVGQDTLDAVDVALDWLRQERAANPQSDLYLERRVSLKKVIGTEDMDGTGDINIVSPDELVIADYKNGKWDNDAREQMMAYLIGLIAEFGVRPKYRCVVIQPRCSDVDAVREFCPTMEDLKAYIVQLRELYAAHESGNATRTPGTSQCQFCPGSKNLKCKEYHEWVMDQVGFPELPTQDVFEISDEELSKILTFGAQYENHLAAARKLAYTRAMDGRPIIGHKLVEGKRTRVAKLSSEEIEKQLRADKVKVGDIYSKKMKTIPQLEKVLKTYSASVQERFKGAWEFSPGKPRLVLESASGKPFTPESPFKELD